MLDDTLQSQRGASMSEREFRFSGEDFRAIAAILHDEAGISLPESKAPLVYARLAKRLRTLGLADFASYVARLKASDATDERLLLVTALTTNVTRFFREPHHFEHLRNVTLPRLLSNRARSNRIRLWSAACSTGQEPYSIAATIIDQIQNTNMDVKILATDIDSVVLAQARSGRYDSIEGVPPEAQRYFRRDGDDWVVDPSLQRLITFRQLNLNATWPFSGSFSAIFCRNVAIYFDQQTQSRLWASFARVTQPGDVLYIGHSERIAGDAAAKFDNVGVTTYQRRSDAR